MKIGSIKDTKPEQARELTKFIIQNINPSYICVGDIVLERSDKGEIFLDNLLYINYNEIIKIGTSHGKELLAIFEEDTIKTLAIIQLATTMLRNKKYLIIEVIVIAQNFRKHKIGSLLIRHIITNVKENNYDFIFAEIGNANTTARISFEKNGFISQSSDFIRWT